MTPKNPEKWAVQIRRIPYVKPRDFGTIQQKNTTASGCWSALTRRRAVAHHRYYGKHLAAYPASRKAILPFVY